MHAVINVKLIWGQFICKLFGKYVNSCHCIYIYLLHYIVQGDVIVGWINAATGKGGVDDYFLSGNLQIENRTHKLII